MNVEKWGCVEPRLYSGLGYGELWEGRVVVRCDELINLMS